jgi:hypothetical protein
MRPALMIHWDLKETIKAAACSINVGVNLCTYPMNTDSTAVSCAAGSRLA